MIVSPTRPAVHPTAAIPLSERRSPLTMGLLWVTMVTAFPSVLIGFEWYQNDLTLPQVILGTILSCCVLLIYSIPATQLGARTGQGYTIISRGVFGRWGSRLVTINLLWFFTLAYGLMALLLADSLKGLLHIDCNSAWLGAGLAIVMSVNNFFGFKGVANFARYFAAPLLIVWVAYTFCKATISCPTSVWTETPHQSLSFALTTVSTFVVGFSVWGNEKDYWRFSSPKPMYSAIPLAAALAIGGMIFPITGWMVARMSHITDYATATAFMNNYSFGGIGWIAALVLGASYFAANDSTLFGSTQAGESLKSMPHRYWVALLALLGAAVAYLLSATGAAKSLDAAVALNCVVMPTPTVIMLTEWFLLSRIFKNRNIENVPIESYRQIPAVRWPALAALLAAFSVGLSTSGAIPGTEFLHVGICSIQAWVTAIIVYVPLRLYEHKRLVTDKRLTLEKVLVRRFEDGAARIPIATE